MMPVIGNKIKNNVKYRIDATWPIIIQGCSTGIPPIHVNTSISATKVQNRNWVAGRNANPRCLEVWRMGTTIKTKIENNRAKTPPNLLGIDRKIAQANRKYHSGLMWGGVTKGLAGVKFSGSPRRFGENNASNARESSITTKPRRSLLEK